MLLESSCGLGHKPTGPAPLSWPSPYSVLGLFQFPDETLRSGELLNMIVAVIDSAQVSGQFGLPGRVSRAQSPGETLLAGAALLSCHDASQKDPKIASGNVAGAQSQAPSSALSGHDGLITPHSPCLPSLGWKQSQACMLPAGLSFPSVFLGSGLCPSCRGGP